MRRSTPVRSFTVEIDIKNRMDGQPVTAVIAELERGLSRIPREHRHTATFEVGINGGYDEIYAELAWERPLTIEERAELQDQAAARLMESQRLAEEKDQAEYLRLRAKYDRA